MGGGGGGGKRSQSPRVPRSLVQRSKGPEDQDISNSNSNTSLTLKKVHLVCNAVYRKINLTCSFLVVAFS